MSHYNYVYLLNHLKQLKEKKMNTPVNFEIAKLLKEKSYDNVTDLIYMTNHTAEVLFENINELKHSDGNNPFCSAPTISEVVMWLYEKHGVWIRVEPDWDGDFWAQIKSISIPDARIGKWTAVHALAPYNSPTEAYEKGILYALQNLI